MHRSARIWSFVLGAVVAWTLSVAGVGAAQSSIPDGVFVRNSEGLVWLVLDGQRIKIPVWAATDDEIAAIPVPDRWAVMNGDGAIVAGDRPAWLAADAPPVAVAPPPTTAPATPTATPAPAARTNRVGESVLLTSGNGARIYVTVHRGQTTSCPTSWCSRHENGPRGMHTPGLPVSAGGAATPTNPRADRQMCPFGQRILSIWTYPTAL